MYDRRLYQAGPGALNCFNSSSIEMHCEQVQISKLRNCAIEDSVKTVVIVKTVLIVK